jgi:hypothetical protein
MYKESYRLELLVGIAILLLFIASVAFQKKGVNGNQIVAKIEAYKLANKRLPKNLIEVGFDKGVKNSFHYFPKDTSYVIYYRAWRYIQYYESKNKVWKYL